jgi:Fungal specific transcription factor domain
MAGISTNSLNAGIPRPELSRLMLAADTDHKISDQLKLHLIDLFFTWQNPWCQVVDESLFRQSRANHGRFHSLLLEYCILAYGSRFTDTQDVRSDPADPNSAGRLFYEKAQDLLYYDLKRPSLTTIQALALMNTLHVVSIKARIPLIFQNIGELMVQVLRLRCCRLALPGDSNPNSPRHGP